MTFTRNFSVFILVAGFSYLLGMEKQDEKYLQFTVSKKLVILSAVACHMQFAVPHQDFLNKNILSVLPLSDNDKANIAAGFDMAAVKKTDQNVSYALGGKQYSACISPDFVERKCATEIGGERAEKLKNYSVNVTEKP